MRPSVFSFAKPEHLIGLFKDCGIEEPECTILDVPTVFRNFDDLWSPFLGGQGPAPTYLDTLPADRQARLCEQVRAHLPIAKDGSIHLMARAFAIRGIEPA
jgi:hypothetical protein